MNQFTNLFDQLAPYSVGFDKFMDSFANSAVDNWSSTTYPPYNILKTGETTYAIQLAVAGLSEKDLEIEYETGSLKVKFSGTVEKATNEQTFIYRGLSARKFTKEFKLAEHVIVTSANCKNGILTINLEREIPDKNKPKKINIT